MKKKDRQEREDMGNQPLGAMCNLLKGGVLAGIVAIIFLLLCATLVGVGVLRESWMDGAVLAVCLIGALVGGLYAVKQRGKRTLLVGLGVGLVLFLLLLTGGLLVYNSASIERGGVGILSACLCGGGLAGVLGSRTKKKRRR